MGVNIFATQLPENFSGFCYTVCEYCLVGVKPKTNVIRDKFKICLHYCS